MPVEWTIQGQTGKAFNATVRTLATAKIDNAVLTFRNLDSDTLDFTITPENLLTATIPENGQTMAMYRNGSLFFHGSVTSVRTTFAAGLQQCQVTVSGPWWWLDKIPFTSMKTDGTGATAERLSYVFGTSTSGQDLRTSIIAAIDRSVALGAPLQNYASGDVSAMTTFPRITLNQSSCALVISELVRLVPDTMVWFDYSVTPARMKVQRRAGATARVIDIATAPVESLDIQPITELQVSQVVLPFIDRDVQGRTRFQVQSSGTNIVGKRQIITVSGPELDTFLPNDLFDSYQIRNVRANTSGLGTFVIGRDGSLSEIAKNNGLASLPIAVHQGVFDTIYGSTVSSATGTPSYYSTIEIARPAPTLQGANGTLYPLTRFVVTTGTLPEWVLDKYSMIEVTLTGDIFYYHQFNYYDGSSPTSSIALPRWVNDVGFTSVYNGFTELNRGEKVGYYFKSFTMQVYIMTTSIFPLTTVYRDADYSFINPPSGLAAFLQGAQSWLPYEGNINLTTEDVGGTRYRGTKISVSNSIPAFSSMDALVDSETLDIASGTTTITLGAPPRNDYRNLVDKIRKTAQDNIVYV